ncbi:glycosyltransferase family 2 protein [Methanobrevibacter arboriphilus]|uniref:glycosyltransferase family 2 protein n=1 Tax=Methanobrevibacter arboriphilus TaxID=39441 RepID=UPI0006935264|nr:glycosyltransferase family 2 protein [Methanobrevibacter arboriphilus]
MPIFNAEKYLETSLNSIVNQSIGIENLQVILVNDGSTDKTKNIINEYAMKYDNFLAIHLENNIGGAYGPRNIGLKYAVADYLMFLDSDDRYELNACEILYNKISSETYGNLDIVFGRYKRVYSNFNDFNNNSNNYNSSNLFNSSNSSNKYHDHEYIQKSYSPYADNIDEFSDDILYNHYLSSISFFFWKNIFSPLFYGKK